MSQNLINSVISNLLFILLFRISYLEKKVRNQGVAYISGVTWFSSIDRASYGSW